MIIAGKNAVTEALSAGVAIKQLYVAKGAHDMDKIVSAARERRVPVRFEERQALDRLSEGVRHQGVIAVGEEFEYTEFEQLAALNRGRDAAPVLLVLDGGEDPPNLGSILRVAECAGVDGVIIPARRSASVNATVIRVSAGAAAHVKVAKVGNVNDAIRRLKEEFFKVYCADMGGESMYDADFSGAIALVIGGEGSGVSRLTAKLCDKALSIPQFGKVNSLNASVACGVLCYEAIRARRGKK